MKQEYEDKTKLANDDNKILDDHSSNENNRLNQHIEIDKRVK